MRTFIVGAYWGGLMAAAIGLLPIVILRPGFISVELQHQLNAAVPALVPIRIKDVELARLTAQPPKVGDQVVMSARASGAKPASFYLTAVASA